MKDIVEISPSDLDFIIEQIEDIKDEEITLEEKNEIRDRILENNRNNQSEIDPDLLVYSKLCKIRSYLTFFGGDKSDINDLIKEYEEKIRSDS